MKISEKMQVAMKENRTFFSFEYFPPRTDEASLLGAPPLPASAVQLTSSCVLLRFLVLFSAKSLQAGGDNGYFV
jgi:hypothetical protein